MNAFGKTTADIMIKYKIGGEPKELKVEAGTIFMIMMGMGSMVGVVYNETGNRDSGVKHICFLCNSQVEAYNLLNRRTFAGNKDFFDFFDKIKIEAEGVEIERQYHYDQFDKETAGKLRGYSDVLDALNGFKTAINLRLDIIATYEDMTICDDKYYLVKNPN